LVISDDKTRAGGASMLVLIPKADSVELRLYRDTSLVKRVEIDRSQLYEQLERLMAEFRGAGNL
jgi:hypothetical protein